MNRQGSGVDIVNVETTSSSFQLVVWGSGEVEDVGGVTGTARRECEPGRRPETVLVLDVLRPLATTRGPLKIVYCGDQGLVGPSIDDNNSSPVHRYSIPHRLRPVFTSSRRGGGERSLKKWSKLELSTSVDGEG